MRTKLVGDPETQSHRKLAHVGGKAWGLGGVIRSDQKIRTRDTVTSTATRGAHTMGSLRLCTWPCAQSTTPDTWDGHNITF